jgi:predicted nuclease of restriction endonuclease-like (RecB) superfamily
LDVGRLVSSVQSAVGWGKGVIPLLARDIKNDFPEVSGFSERNIGRMKAFFREYPFLPQPGAKLKGNTSEKDTLPRLGARLAECALRLPWRTNILLIEKVKDLELRLAYMHAAIENGWSRDVLSFQIQNRTCERKGKALTNLSRTFPPADSDMAQQTLKDPYIFGFTTFEEPYKERELELALIAHIENFLLELGVGFAFVGRQYSLDVGETESRVDLLFYHLKLRCFVVIDLKKGQFKPEYAGKLNYYLNIVDDRLRHPTDNPTIGLILCQDRNEIVAEYALKGIDKSIGISEYRLTQALPEEFKRLN